MPLDLVAVDCVEDAFRALATLPVAMPPILRLDIPEHRGEVDVKTAYVPGLDSFAIKISPGFFDNPTLGLPSTNGMMVVLSARTGLVQALLLDNGYLTDVRTAAAGAVAARHLAARGCGSSPRSSERACRREMQLRALTLVRPIRQARIWARDLAKGRGLPRRMTAEPRHSGHRALKPWRRRCTGADVIVTTTPATAPILQADAAPGPAHHRDGLGRRTQERDRPRRCWRAPAMCADRLAQTRALGELHHAIAAGVDRRRHANLPNLAPWSRALRPGRAAAAEITIADLTGTGIQDTAIAALAAARARAAGAGHSITV